MSKFKVGDKVRRIRSIPGSDIAVGEVCTIASVTIDDIVYLEGRGAVQYLEKNFELVQENPAPKTKGHPHAELMAQYAEDAKETDKPWERWEVKNTCPSDDWSPVSKHPLWLRELMYRRKPSTININGYEVPEPVRVLQGGETYYCPYIGTGRQELDIAQWRHGSGFIVPRHLVEMGLVHTTREAAELHAKALLSFTNGKG